MDFLHQMFFKLLLRFLHLQFSTRPPASACLESKGYCSCRVLRDCPAESVFQLVPKVHCNAVRLSAFGFPPHRTPKQQQHQKEASSSLKRAIFHTLKPLSLKLLVRMEKVPQDQDMYRAEPCWVSCGFHLDYHSSNHKRERGKFEQNVFPCNI